MRLGGCILTILLLAVLLPTVGPVAASSLPITAPDRSSWVDVAMWYRSLGGSVDGDDLPPAWHDPGLDAGPRNHVDYLAWLRTQGSEHCGHGEDPDHRAPANTNREHDVLFCGVADLTTALDGWMATPFHGRLLVDPLVKAFGGASNPSAPASAVDYARRSFEEQVALEANTYVWPRPGAVLPFLEYLGAERPDPQASCPPIGATSGPTIFVERIGGAYTFAAGNGTHRALERGRVADSVIVDNQGVPVPHCRLGERNAMLFPRQPLEPATTYTVTVSVQPQRIVVPGGSYVDHGAAFDETWSFRTRADDELCALLGGGSSTSLNPVTPMRVEDTRSTGRLSPLASRWVAIASRLGVHPSCIAAAVVNVTSTGATAPSFVSLWPSGTDWPGTSTLNTEPGQDTPNLAIVGTGSDGGLAYYNHHAQGHLVIDVLAWIPTGSRYRRAEGRVADTRDGVGVRAGRIGPGETLEIDVAGREGVPSSGVAAVVVNITSTAASVPSYLTVWPRGEPRPAASSLSTDPGQDTPNLAIVEVGADGGIALYNNAGSGHVVVDLMGWFPTDGGYLPVTPTRVLDTRQTTSLGARSTSRLRLDPPPGATAVAMNVTSTAATQRSYISIWPSGRARPLASNLNTAPGQDTPNFVIVGLGDAGAVDIYNDAGAGHLVVDVVGWFT